MGACPLTYANVISTLALFLALGGGAWAASGGFVSSTGTVTACVPRGGGVVRVVKKGGHCRRRDTKLALAHGPVTVKGPAGPVGPPGPAGAPGPGGYSFFLGPIAGGTLASSFAGNQMRLNCEGGKCSADVAISGPGMLLGTDQRGATNGPVTTSRTVSAETPTTVALTSVSGAGMASVGHATVWVSNNSGWLITVALISEESGGNVRLVGTAVPTSNRLCVGGAPIGSCPWPSS